MKVFILGGNRYVGLKLLKLIQEKSEIDDVFTLSRTKNFYNFKNHHFGNRQDVKLLESLLLKNRPDILIDMICFSKNDIQGILHLKRRGVLDSVKHYIVISSFFVYNYFPYKQFKEKNLSIKYLRSPIQEQYTMQKVEMETALMQSDLFELSSIVRFPFIFSSDDYTKRFQNFCEQAFSKTNVFFSNNYKFSMISKNCAAFGLYELCTQKPPQGYVDLANDGCISQKQIYKDISDIGFHKKRKRSLENNIYDVKTNLCISTKKISFKKNLREHLYSEAEKLFNKIKNT